MMAGSAGKGLALPALSEERLGIDIGGSGIKGAVVDPESGSLLGERLELATPQPATPEAVGEAVAELVGSVDYRGPVGIGFPAVVRGGEVLTANNIDSRWIGHNAGEVFTHATSRDVTVLNDADGAALAESAFGAARGVAGLVVMITFGTGIGSGVVVDGHLVYNVELGRIELDGHRPAELHFSAKAREDEGLSWEEWGIRANRFLSHINDFLNPKLVVVGGGVTHRWERFADHFDPSLPLVKAAMGNNAGIVGAALASMQSQSP